jgi:IMP dehydrogenase
MFPTDKEYLTYDDINIVPNYSEVESRAECSTESQLTSGTFLSVPICAAPMDTVCGKDMATAMYFLGGMGFIHRFNTIDEQINELPDGVCLRAASVGVTGDWWERCQELIKNKVAIILIDVAHGHHINVKRALLKLKSEYDVQVVAGNVATYNGTVDLINWGADAVRVGLGNGSLCETRIRTGVGIPQVTALIECVRARDYIKRPVPIIADGGIRFVGDVPKALSLGADVVMLGSLLAGTKETPGAIARTGTWPNEQLFKSYRGSASLQAKVANNLDQKNVEGNSKLIPYKGKVSRIISDITDGLRSSMSYVGVKTLGEFSRKAKIIRVTHAGLIEASPHLLNE